MSWHDPTRTMIPFAFYDTQGLACSGELFPSRVDAPQGLETGIRGLVVAMLSPTHGRRWSRHLDNSLDGSEAASNSFLTVRAGGLSLGAYQPLPDAHTWTVSDTHITDPDGLTSPLEDTIPRFFCAANRHPQNPLLITTPLNGLIAAVAASAQGIPAKHVFLNTTVFAAFAGALLTPPTARKKRTSRGDAHNAALTIIRVYLESTGCLQADRLWMPRTMVATGSLTTIARELPQPQPESFLACVQAAFGTFMQASQEARKHLWDHLLEFQHSQASAHAVLQSQHLVHTIEEQLCTHGSAWFSRPKA